MRPEKTRRTYRKPVEPHEQKIQRETRRKPVEKKSTGFTGYKTLLENTLTKPVEPVDTFFEKFKKYRIHNIHRKPFYGFYGF